MPQLAVQYKGAAIFAIKRIMLDTVQRIKGEIEKQNNYLE